MSRPIAIIGGTGPQGAVGWGTIAYDAATYRLTLQPQVLLPSTTYNFAIGANVTDWAGNPVNVATRAWSFSTEAEPVYAWLRAHFLAFEQLGAPWINGDSLAARSTGLAAPTLADEVVHHAREPGCERLRLRRRMRQAGEQRLLHEIVRRGVALN